MKPKQLVTLKIINKSHPLRQAVEQYVASRYLLAFDAHITEFMPTFLGVYSEQNELLSVCGYRIASQEPLIRCTTGHRHRSKCSARDCA